jgi:uncharacterized coiled-coil protein SlyX
VKTLLSKLSSLNEVPLDLILYIGAGSSVDLSDYGALNPKRLVLVEGDPDAVEQLTRSLAQETSCQVLSALITPDGAKRPFYRYSLPFVNGPLPMGDLRTLYPRLKVVEELELPSKTLSTLLETIPIAGEGKRLLIIDIPGQETAILGSSNPEQLRAFEWILVRGCRKALQGGAQSMEASITRLEGSLFERVVTDVESNPAWPVGLLHFDRRMAVRHNDLENRARLLLEKAIKIDQQAKRIAGLESQLKSGQGELDGARQRLGELTRQLEERTAQLGSANERLPSLEADLASQKTLVEVLSKGRSQQDKLYKEQSQELDGLRARIEELNARILEMEGLVADKETRGKFIDNEFQKVEGQLDLIKEIFLREKIR